MMGCVHTVMVIVNFLSISRLLRIVCVLRSTRVNGCIYLAFLWPKQRLHEFRTALQT
jgi:hypothetical protein